MSVINPIQAAEDLSTVRYGTESVDSVKIFFREAGDPTKPAIVLLHGFPASSHQYRELLSALGDKYYLIAPDYPGYGYSDKPASTEYSYTFDNLADTMDKFITKKGIKNYTLVMHDFGGPVGFRIASKVPSKITGLVVMNANAYEEGLSDIIKQNLNETRNPENDAKNAATLLSLAGIQWQYVTGSKNPEGVNPDNWWLHYALLNNSQTTEINLALLDDYKNNIPLYKNWQKYLRHSQPPMLIVWGKNDPIFTEAGAAAYKKDLTNVSYHLLDTGHFPLEEQATLIASKMQEFIDSIQQ